jgi:restriction system protein
MTLWLIRAGSRGEHEQKFLDESKVYLTWGGFNADISPLSDRQALIQLLEQVYPDEKPKALINASSQIWSFGRDMSAGDWVVMPSKIQSGLYFGELKGSYNYAASGPDPYFHWRAIDWFSGLIPRSVFPQDLLYSFGAFLTICKVQRNDAEARVRAMAGRHWQPEGISAIGARPTADPGAGLTVDEAEVNNVDLAELAADRIVRLIEARFKGHGLAELVEAILQAEGYTTYRSPEGADGGADILAAGGELGFGSPSICVEVKSGDTPADRPMVDKLIGAAQKFNAETCLFVSWAGFKSNVQKELARDFSECGYGVERSCWGNYSLTTTSCLRRCVLHCP